MALLVEKVDPTAGDRLVPGHRLNGLDTAHQLHHSLVVRRHLLGTQVGVELAARIVRMVVGGRDVQTAVCSQATDHEGQLGCGEKAPRAGLQHVHIHAVCCVDRGRFPSHVVRGHAQQRVRDIRWEDPAKILEDANVRCDHHRQLRVITKAFTQEVNIALHRRSQCPGIHPIGSDPDRATTPACPKGKDAVKRVQQGVPTAGLDECHQ